MYTLGIAKTDVGKQRSRNEDTVYANSEQGLYIISDGMGGHKAGDVASARAVEVAVRVLTEEMPLIRKVADGREEPEVLADLARKAVEAACREVYHQARSRLEYHGMGGTLTVLQVAGSKAAMAHVGDTRLYLLRDGEAHQLSTDHTLAAELIKGGVLTPETAKGNRYNSVLTRAIGNQESVQVDTLLLDVLPGDRFLLCSDGLSEYVPDEAWLAQEMTTSADDFEELPDVLVAHANDAGGSDNIGVVVVRVEAGKAERPLVVALSEEMEVKMDALTSVFLFEDLTLAQLSRILNACEVRSLETGQVLLPQGEPCSRLVINLDGALKVSRGDDTTAELEAGEHLGATTLLYPRQSRASVRAASPTRVLVLEREAFLALTRERPWLGVALLQRLGRRLSRDLDRALDGAASRKGNGGGAMYEPAELF